jgi:hypothetical protein
LEVTTDQHDQLGEGIQLYHLALSCFAFDALTHYNTALSELRKRAALPIDLMNSEHRVALFTWLNAWRTRIPERVFRSAHLEGWYLGCKESLAPAGKCLWELSNEDIQAAEHAYDKLASLLAGAAGQRRPRCFSPCVPMP